MAARKLKVKLAKKQSRKLVQLKPPRVIPSPKVYTRKVKHKKAET